MAYNPNIPATGHSASQDYVPMQQNFAQIQASFSVDHQPLAVGTNEGFHKKSTYIAVAADPTPGANLGIAYSKTVNAHTELFYEGEVTTGKILQITDQSLDYTKGEGYIPGGLQIRSSNATANNPNVNVVFTTPFPTAVISVVCTSYDKTNTIKVENATKTGFQAGTANLTNIYYIATGY